MARIQDVVFDCAHPASLARFWAATLDSYQVAPYDETELTRLRGEDIDDPEDDPTVLVEAGPASATALVPAGSRGQVSRSKNRSLAG